VLGNREIAPPTFNPSSRWRRVVSFKFRSLYFGVRAPGTHWVGGWLGHRAGVDAVTKRKIPIIATDAI